MKLIAHRGRSAGYPDNTLAAFRAAIDSGFTEIECDVQQTRDRVLVLCHDLDMSQIAGVDKSFADSDYAELASLDVGSWFDAKFSGERLAKFEELLQRLPDSVPLHVDVKQVEPPYEGIEERIVELTGHRLGNTTFASKSVEAMRRFRALGSNLRLGFQPNFTPIDESFEVGRELKIESLRLSKYRVDAEWMARAAAENWDVYVYSVSTVADYRRLEQLGVHRIFTGDPGLGQQAAP
jgi:glycerophosphoryl diester phosphodiesterase